MNVRVVRALMPYAAMLLIGLAAVCAVRTMDTHNWWWAVPGVTTWIGSMVVLLLGGSWLAEQDSDSTSLSERSD